MAKYVKLLKTVIFLLGIILGICLHQFFISPGKIKIPYKLTRINWDTLRYNHNISSKLRLESDYLFKKVKIMCIILLKQAKNENGIRNTWATRCTSVKVIHIPKQKLVKLRAKRENLTWDLLKQIIKKIKPKMWVLIVSDYTFVVMENLRFFLNSFNVRDDFYFGYAKKFWGVNYNVKEGGIVLSFGAVDKLIRNDFGENVFKISTKNREDYFLGKVLSKLNIFPKDTRDFWGLSRFHPISLNKLILFSDDYQNDVFPNKCCSSLIISFVILNGDNMYSYYYYIYTLQIFTSGNIGNIPNLQENDESVWKDFLKSQGISNINISNQEYWTIWKQLINGTRNFTENIYNEL